MLIEIKPNQCARNIKTRTNKNNKLVSKPITTVWGKTPLMSQSETVTKHLRNRVGFGI